MGKQSRGTCVYCMRSIPTTALTKDHVIAEAWYPASTPPNTEKWKVPSCVRCNHKFGQIEQDLLIRFGLCLDPDDPTSASVAKKAMDSINPDLGTSDREKRARRALKRKILQDVKEIERLPTKGVLPDLGRNWHSGSRHGVLIPAKELHQIIRKWVRGLHYLTLGRLLPRSAKIEVFHVTDDVANAAFRDIEPYAPTHIKPPGIFVMQAPAVEGNEAETIYRFVLWDQYKVCAAVSERFPEPP